MILLTTTVPTTSKRPRPIHAYREVRSDVIVTTCGHRFPKQTVTVAEGDADTVTCGLCLDLLDHDRVYIGHV